MDGKHYKEHAASISWVNTTFWKKKKKEILLSPSGSLQNSKAR